MSAIFYRNFDIQILRAGEEYLAQTESPDAGNASLNFTLPFSENGLDALLSKLGPPRRVRGVETPIEAAKRLGGQLYKAVFSAGIGSALNRSIEAAKRASERLRIRLRLTNVPELANLPWEYLYDEPNDRFLALSYETSIVRYLEVPQPVNPLAVKPPLRALVMASSPIGYDALGVDKEWSNLQTALGKMPRGLVEVNRTEKATLEALQERLSGGNQYHIFHYIGHGGFDPRTGKSVLVMEDDHRQARFVDGPQLGVLLHNHPSLRLAILNACEGAVSNHNDVFTGVAQNLIRQEVPAVVAMQFEITDSVAIILAKAFYESLARSAPVDTALAEARLAVFAADDGIEWGTPVLYLRAPDGRLFDVESLPTSVSQPAPNADAPSQTTGQRKPENLPPTEPSGTLSASSSFYIEREADKQAMEMIAWPGITLSIKASGQTGASSLLLRLMDAARRAGKQAEARRTQWSESGIAELVNEVFFRQAEQDSNIRAVRDLLTKRAPDVKAVLTTYRKVLRGKRVIDEERSPITSHLKLSGVVRRNGSGALDSRNRVYRRAFDERWVKEHAPVDWRKRFLYALIVMLMVLPLITIPLSVYAWNRKGEAQRAAEREKKAGEAEREARLLAEQRRSEAESERKNALTAAGSERKAKLLAEKRQAIAEQERNRAKQSAIAEQNAKIEAESQRKIVRSREIAAYAKLYIKSDPELSFQLAARAIKLVETDQALDALREALPQTFLHAQLQGHTDSVRSAAFSPDGKWVVTASFDMTARVWEAATGRSLATLQRHTSFVNSAAFSPDSKLVVTASGGNTARVWEAATGRSLATFQEHTSFVNSAAFSPDGKWIITASRDNTARVYPYEMFAPAEEVIERAQQRVLRALTPLEQARFGIEEQLPRTERQEGTAPRP